MTINPQDISLQSMDDILVAENEQGHLTAPLLFLQREAVPDDAEDFESVLVFSDGKTRAVIDSTILVLHKGNGWTQSLGIETGGAWTISGINEDYIWIDPEFREGVGDIQIDVQRASSLIDEPGFHCCEFLLSIEGAVVSESVIHVFIFNGAGLGPIQRTSVTLDESNEYEYELNLSILEGCLPDGVDEGYFTVTENSEGGVFLVKAVPLPRDYKGMFYFLAYDPEEEDAIVKVLIVEIMIDASIPLEVSWWNPATGHYDIARHGETLTVTLTAPNYDSQSLTINRDRYWEIGDDDSALLTVLPSSRQYPDYTSESVTLSKIPNLEVGQEAIETSFQIISQSQRVYVDVIFQAPITGQFISPPDGIGVSGGTAPVYIYI
jgi:hypothetical protein